MNQETITGDSSTGIAFDDKTLASGSYDAEMDLNSVYVSLAQRFATSYQAIFGVRYESYEQTTDTFSLQGAQLPETAVIDDDAVLPTLSLNWEISDSQQLRFAASQTISRPDFKETSNATFYEADCDCRVRGNPNLVPSDVTNFDLRWEWYWSDTENVSVALFQKTFDAPIERVLLTASGTAGNSRTYENSNQADLFGIEFDTRKDFDLTDSGSRALFATVNASYIESEIELDSGETRKLQGQPDYTFNLVLGYDDYTGFAHQEVTLLLNQSGETIVDVGQTGLSNISEEPRMDLDLNYKINFSDSLVFKAKAGNLLDEAVEFTQGGRVFQEYKQGVTFEAGIDWKF